MNHNIISKGIFKGFFLVLLFLCLIYFVFTIRLVIGYICVSAIISLILRPFVNFLIKKLKFRKFFAVVTTISISIVTSIGFFSLFIPIFSKQIENLSLLDMNQLEIKIRNLIIEISKYISIYGENWKDIILSQNLFSNLNLKSIPIFFNGLLNLLSGFTIGFFSISFITFFFLIDENLLEKITLYLTNTKQELKLKKSFIKINYLLRRYFVGLIIQIIILFIIYSSLLYILEIQNALIISLIAALLNIIPYVGPFISGILIILLTMTSNIEMSFLEVLLPKTIYVFSGFIFGQLIDNFVSQPLIFSRSIKSHPLEIFIVILCFGYVFGILGLILAIPIYTSIKVIINEFFSKKDIIKIIEKF